MLKQCFGQKCEQFLGGGNSLRKLFVDLEYLSF